MLAVQNGPGHDERLVAKMQEIFLRQARAIIGLELSAAPAECERQAAYRAARRAENP
jgi:hypothetical protein